LSSASNYHAKEMDPALRQASIDERMDESLTSLK
jgi:hypothetical protein